MNWRKHFDNGIRGSVAKQPDPRLFGALRSAKARIKEAFDQAITAMLPQITSGERIDMVQTLHQWSTEIGKML
jgi:hypothetical protein